MLKCFQMCWNVRGIMGVISFVTRKTVVTHATVLWGTASTRTGRLVMVGRTTGKKYIEIIEILKHCMFSSSVVHFYMLLLYLS